MNILSFDIEEWYIDKVRGVSSKRRFANYDRILNQILDILEFRGQKATFFCLGGIADYFPEVVKRIASRGHEIGCHSYEHKWANKMTPDEFRNDTCRALDSLQNLIGQKVVSYRAPAFSIGESNKWTIDILTQEGIENDASIFPGIRDFGGFPSFNSQVPCLIKHNNSMLCEFPIPLISLPFGKQLAYSGGGYFRLLPLEYIIKQMKSHNYNMCYFHLGDLIQENNGLMSQKEYEDYFKESGTLKNRVVRYIKSNIGRKNAFAHLSQLIELFDFISIKEYKAKNSVDNVIII